MTMLPRFFHLLGSDRYLTPAEVERATDSHPLIPTAWDAYRQHFHEFAGTALDPLFHRLTHPSRRYGSIHLESGTAVVIVGTGPSLRRNIARLKQLEGRVRIFTSPRGAEALLPHGIIPDLVLVEHQTALDAHHSARHLGDCPDEVLSACPLVAADWRTPAALLRGVSGDALFVPASLPTWGLWTATAAAMAVEAGASRVALLGVDLGTAAEPDAAHLPLAAVLALIARLAPVVMLDCGAGGSTKRGWLKASIEEAAGVSVAGVCDISTHHAPPMQERFEEARAALAAHGRLVEHARGLLALAAETRTGNIRPLAHLDAAVREMMAWRQEMPVRLFAQECLGLSFMPRLWRLGIDPALGRAMWRPLMLAMHELVRQADELGGITRAARAA
jgi:hypothetical protein